MFGLFKKKSLPADPLDSLAQDIVLRISDDAAHMALVDVRTDATDLPGWDCESLTRKRVAAMNAGQLVAWDHPEENLAVRLTGRCCR
ncbi:hypothetical protein FGE12_26815 [Aggregicoccus sp. 17bor-14]|uniref:hypothetical protein n=1 Tax=Myxococcaceae TaxID=31 RepID=UPI00129C44F8|nr:MULTISPECIES: hypothetical protein [Myxococcaceae]MBF5046055.1 hypothetical protein [Simulacricoccus sp. 17bor-14]MRI91785.1 hypothetical protein [Aggregicoccus sp. 17bor-14]